MNRFALLLLLLLAVAGLAACATTEKEKKRDRTALELVDPSTPQFGQQPEAIRP